MSGTKKVQIETAVFKILHDQIIAKFRSSHPDKILPEYKLYGYAAGGEKHPEEEISIRSELIKTYENSNRIPPSSLKNQNKWKINGKFLRDAYKIKADTDDPVININGDYLEAFLLYLGFADLETYRKHLVKENILATTLPSATSKEKQNNKVKFKGYTYVGLDIDRVISFDMILKDGEVKIPKSPYYERCYSGKVDESPDNYGLNLHSSLTLYSSDHANSKYELKFILSGNAPLNERLFATGYYVVISNTETCTGPFIIENQMVNDLLNPENASTEELHISESPVNIDSFLNLVFGKALSSQNKEAYLALHASIPRNFLEFMRAKWNPLFSRRELLEKYLDWKKSQFFRYLNNQHFCMDNYLESTHHAFGSFLENVHPGWKNNQQLLKNIAGDYAMFIGCWEPNPITGAKEKKIELIRFVLTREGKVSCKTNGDRLFKGTIEIFEQRLMQFRLKKVDGNSNYLVILKIPDVIHDKEATNYTFTGIFGGISMGLKPRADKALLQRIDLSDKNAEEKYKPRFIDYTKTDIVNNLIKDIPGFKDFFSLRSENDRFLQGSNLFFSNLLELPDSVEDIIKVAGVYDLYRLNMHNKVIKRYPIRIGKDGDATFIRGNSSMEGKAFLINKQVIVHFFTAGAGILTFPVFSGSDKYKEGILTSNSHTNTPFANKVVLVKTTDDKVENHFYKKLIMDDPFFPADEEEYNNYKLASYALYSSPNAIYTQEHNNKHLNETPAMLKEKAMKNHLGKLIVYHFRKTNQPNCKALRSCFKIANRMMEHWGCTQSDVTKLLENYYPNLARRKELFGAIQDYFIPENNPSNKSNYNYPFQLDDFD